MGDWGWGLGIGDWQRDPPLAGGEPRRHARTHRGQHLRPQQLQDWQTLTTPQTGSIPTQGHHQGRTRAGRRTRRSALRREPRRNGSYTDDRRRSISQQAG
jgi:hypothetical protein